MRMNGLERRHQVLDRTERMAAVYGIEGLSLARAADDVGLSKSGLASLFDSKLQLQLETIDHARQLLLNAIEVRDEPGFVRLSAMLRSWNSYVASLDEGGCFFSAVGPEIDDRPGPARQALAEAGRELITLVIDEIRLAQRLGEIEPTIDPARLAFELHAYIHEANYVRRVHDDLDVFVLAQQCIDDRLASVYID